jgi:NAD+ synthase (glutamine-hydrolysing)
MAQINPILGDLRGNTKKIMDFIKAAGQQQIDLLIFPELAITGYSPQDLLLDRPFITGNLECLDQIVQASQTEMVVVLGFVDLAGDKLYNSAALIQSGRLIEKRYKTLLPNYDVFDERRYFTPPVRTCRLISKSTAIPAARVEICEDLWDTNHNQKITEQLVKKGRRTGCKPLGFTLRI